MVRQRDRKDDKGMPFIPTPNVARCAIRFNLFGQDVVNTMWFRKEGLGGISALDLADLGLAIGGRVDADLLPLLSDDLTLVDVTCIDQTSAIDPSVTTPFPGTGGVIGSAAPGNVCMTVKFNTEFRGRAGRGRNYVGGIPETEITGNQVSTTFRDNVVAYYNEYIATPITGWNWVIVSHVLDGVAREEGLAMDVLVATVVDLNVDSQRRRLTGRGT